jgi:transcriptional regulator with XRE-family HTH domain
VYQSENIAKRVKLMAKANNVAIKDLLNKCGLNKNALSSMQCGGSIPRADNLAKIADYLGCSVDYLLGRTDDTELHQK